MRNLQKPADSVTVNPAKGRIVTPEEREQQPADIRYSRSSRVQPVLAEPALAQPG